MQTTIRTQWLEKAITVEEAMNEEYFSCYFRTSEDADKFFASLPKSIKAWRRDLNSWRSSKSAEHEKYGLAFINQGSGSFAPAVSLRISGINKVTGELNESGIKRRAKFIAAIVANCEVVASL